jgi:hypothetical protein
MNFLETFFEKYTNIKFYKKPSGGNRFVPWRQADGRTDMRKLIFAFRNIANALKMKIDLNIVKNVGFKNFVASCKLVAEVRCCACDEEESS